MTPVAVALHASSAVPVKLKPIFSSLSPATVPDIAAAAAPGRPSAAPAAAPAAPAAAAAEPERPANWYAVKAPMVGTFYAAPQPGAPAFVKVGDEVAAGETLCIVEAMKLMNEISAPEMGTIREICVEDSEPVEFGTPLFWIEPHGQAVAGEGA